MKIRNRHSKGQSDGGSLHQGREQRARRFLTEHHVGDHITGQFLKRDPSGLSWVSFDGLPLLAKIDEQPRSGVLLHFIIQALVPDIKLKQTDGKSATTPRSGTHAVVRFDAARNSFETAARNNILGQSLPHQCPKAETLAVRRDALLASLTPSAQAHYLTACLAQATINQHLAASGPTRLYYLPWLLPALRCDCIIRQEIKDDGTDYHELAMSFEHDALGPGQLRMLSRPGRTGVRVFIEQRPHLPIARAVLAALGKELDESVSVLGADTPPLYAKGGVLSQLMASDPHKLIGFGG